MKRIFTFIIFQMLIMGCYAQTIEENLKKNGVFVEDFLEGWMDVLPYIAETKANQDDKDLIRSLMIAVYNNDTKEIFNKATILSQKGYSIGDYYLGWCYEGGEGVPLDMKRAFEYFYKASTNKIPFNWAFRSLGFMYYEDYLGESDYQKALYWFDKGCQEIRNFEYKGQSYNLRGLIYRGEGNVPLNEFETFKSYEAAAKLGYPIGVENFGKFLITSEKYRNLKEGWHWIEIAAKLGMMDSQFLYGNYLFGEGNEIEGIKYIKLAASQGDFLAMKFLEEYEEYQNRKSK